MIAALLPAVPGVAGMCAAGAVLAFPGRTAQRRLDLLFELHDRRRPPWMSRRVVRAGKMIGPTLGAGLLCAVVFHSPAMTLVVPVGVWRAHRAWERRIARLTVDRRRAESVALCLAFRAELRGGRPARDALRDAVENASPELIAELEGPLLLGGEVVPVLRRAALDEGREALSYLAACWQASEGGAGLAHAVGRLATSLRAAENQRREVAGELAGVRASSRLLAGLPVLGLLLGTALGAAPARILLSTTIGQACLVAGGACVLGGLAWMERIVRSAEALA